VNAEELDLGGNYYFRDGFKATASYGREFSSFGNFKPLDNRHRVPLRVSAGEIVMTSRHLLCGLLALTLFSTVAAGKAGRHNDAAPVPVQHSMTDDERARRRGKAVSGELRALPSVSAQVSAAHDAHHRTPYAVSVP